MTGFDPLSEREIFNGETLSQGVAFIQSMQRRRCERMAAGSS
jgi:hypothetical protein